MSLRPGRHAKGVRTGVEPVRADERSRWSTALHRCVPQAVDVERSNGSCGRAETGLSRRRLGDPVDEEDRAITLAGWPVGSRVHDESGVALAVDAAAAPAARPAHARALAVCCGAVSSFLVAVEDRVVDEVRECVGLHERSSRRMGLWPRVAFPG